MSIAKRIFKLMILELIAPIPIMSLIDPKGSKDGAFSKWLGNLISTFVDIFIKLGLVYIVIVMIQMIAENGLFEDIGGDNGFFRTAYLRLFLILGLLFFAKEAPKFIKDSLGIKDSGGGLFDDVKSLGKAAAITGGAAVGVAGIAGSMGTNYRASMSENEALHPDQKGLNRAKSIASAIAGGFGGAFAGGKALFGKNAGPGSVMKAQQERNAQRAAHSTFLGRLGAGTERVFTGETAYDKMTRSIASQESLGAAGEALHSYLEDRAVKKGGGYSVSATRDDGKTTISTTYDEFSRAYQRAKQAGTDEFEVDGKKFSTYGAEAARIEGDLKTAAANEWAKEELGKPEGAIDQTFKDFRDAYVNSGGKMENVTDAGALKAEFKTASRKAKIDKASAKYSKYKANAGSSKK